MLLHLVRQIFPNVKAVFSNTGLEYASIQRHVRKYHNVDIIVPPMRFDQVISTYGYPLISKEVAEAIYYARRIRSQNGNVERERERESGAHSASAKNCKGSGNVQKKGQPSSGITERLQNRGGWQTDLQSQTEDQKATGQKNTLIQTSTARNRRTVLSGKLTGTTGEGGVFSNPAGQFGQKSQFNKERWLPMVYTPFMISHYCCAKMKKGPMSKYQHQSGLYPVIGTLAEESRLRKQGWIKHGCNSFDSKKPSSQPLSFWTEQDVLTYIVKYNVTIASVYGDIVHVDQQTGAEYSAVDMFGNIGCNLKCTKCDRTGQINAAR